MRWPLTSGCAARLQSGSRALPGADDLEGDRRTDLGRAGAGGLELPRRGLDTFRRPDDVWD